MKEFFGNLVVYVISYCGTLFCWMIFSAVVNLFLYLTTVYDKISISIKLPKLKKYFTKVDPIFKMYQKQYSSDYYVGKWTLMYDENLTAKIWLFLLIPYPITLLFYRFYEVGTYFLCESKKITELSTDLESIYNKLDEKNRLKEEKEEKERNDKKLKIKELNKIFKENYE
jgi:hypothetical protein